MPGTFGEVISEARKKKALSLRQLAAKISREDGSGPISPQYLNDIELERRNPPGAHLIQQLSEALDLGREYLFLLADQFPTEDREVLQSQPEDEVTEAYLAFRRSLRPDKK